MSWTGRPESRESSPQRRPQPARTPAKSRQKSRSGPTIEEMELIEDYAKVIRSARQKRGLSQEELAQKVGERVSTLQSIEAGRLKPTRKTLRGLERELEISLLEHVSTVPLKREWRESKGSAATLGDVVKIKRKKAQKSE
jgi:putative transcription factor